MSWKTAPERWVCKFVRFHCWWNELIQILRLWGLRRKKRSSRAEPVVGNITRFHQLMIEKKMAEVRWLWGRATSLRKMNSKAFLQIWTSVTSSSEIHPVSFIIILSADSGHLQMCFIDMNACQKKISFGMKRTEPATSHEIGSKHKRRYSETTSWKNNKSKLSILFHFSYYSVP